MDKDTRTRHYKAVFRKAFDFLLEYAFNDKNDYGAIALAYSSIYKKLELPGDKDLFAGLMVAVFEEFARQERRKL